MNLNNDFSQRLLIDSNAVPWTPSPTPGVDRRMLDRIGGEVARATSIVRYAPGSLFPPHTHDGGEEFIVLDGVFQDEHGDYPPGTYVRNPPTTRHKPGSASGCTIFVKLWQFDPAERKSVRIDMNDAPMVADRPGLSAATLYEDARETVRLLQCAPGARIEQDMHGGAELLVLDGSCTEADEVLRPLSWLRIPIGGRLNAIAGESGARVWIKTGGLRFVDPPRGTATETDWASTTP